MKYFLFHHERLFCREKTEKGLAFSEWFLYAFFGHCGRREIEVFGNERSVQKLKLLFLSNLLAWVRIHIKEGSIFFIDFVDWLGSH